MSGPATIRTVSVALFTSMTVGACSGGAPPAQTNVPVVRAVPPQPVRDASGQILTTTVVLPEGTEFTAQTLDFLSSQTGAEGDPVRFEVENNVLINGAIAIAAGSTVKGIVSSVTHASRMGKSGNITLRVETAETVDGQRVKLRASKNKSTDDKLGSTVALAVVLSPLFLLRKGNDVAYQPGTRITVFTDDKVDVRAWRQ